MSAEQGDVEVIRRLAFWIDQLASEESLQGRGNDEYFEITVRTSQLWSLHQAKEAVAAALERAERERDRLIENVQACNERSRNLAEKADRAEKAERALAAAELEKEGARRGEDEAWEKWQKAERALGEMRAFVARDPEWPHRNAEKRNI